MHVPGHVCAMYVATCGQNGPALGSDEKEIILLVYVIIDAATTKIVGVQQYLVRPIGNLGKEQTSQTNLSSTSTTESSSPVNSLQIINSNNNNNSITINNNNTNNTNNSNNNNNNNNINNNNNNNNTIIINQQSTTIIDGIPVQNTELPIDIAQVAGKPLNEVIDQFDAYIRSLSIDPNSTNFRLVTDGQLPIRQCLHPEACAKDIDLPSYYCRFSDLRKEFVRYKSADLSRALVPVKDIKKLTQMPTLPPIPHSIAEMVKELDITTYDDPEFYIKESRDMVSVIQALLAAGHKFEANEIVSLNLEPGICSIDDEIDGSCIVRARGLPWQSSDQDIAKFFRGLNVAKGGVALCLSAQGRRNGEALVRFVSQEHRDLALKRHKHHIGNRYIEVYRATGEDFLAVAGGASNEAQAFLSKGAQVIIRMRGLPYDCTAKQVLDFFTTGDDPCHVLDGTDGVLFVKKPDGRATGDAFVLFASESDAPKALSRHRESIGQRYIELFRSTTAEVQQVLNRSLSIEHKVVELPAPPLLPAPIPTAVPMQLLPQHVITSGSSKNCIRLRGLPYEARVEHILHFLDDFAKNIIYQGVHMIYNAQGQPSGEAFIQMDSEEAARLSAQQKHNQFMVFGKKYRYIEVFQCSGDDINLVINGGIQSPVNATKPALLSPGGTLVGHPFGGFASFGPPTTILPSPHRAHPAFYPQPFVYWGYPSPPVSPTTYFGPAAPPPPPPTHIAASNLTAQHQAATLFPVDYLHPTYQQSPASPSQHHHHHHQHQHHHHHHQSVVVPSTVVTSSPPSNHLHVSPASPATVALHHRHHQQQHNSQQQQSHHLHHNHNQQHHQPCLHSAYSQSLHQYQSATTVGALVPSPQLHHSTPTFHPSATSTSAIQSSTQPQLTIQSTQSTLPPPPAVPSGTISVTPTAIAAAAAATAAAVSATTISMAPATIPSIPLQASPTSNSYPATQHLLTIDTTNIPSPTISIPYDKLTPRVLTPTATTTFALAAATAAAVGPPTFALPTSPVTIPGPAVVANPCVELYIA